MLTRRQHQTPRHLHCSRHNCFSRGTRLGGVPSSYLVSQQRSRAAGLSLCPKSLDLLADAPFDLSTGRQRPRLNQLLHLYSFAQQQQQHPTPSSHTIILAYRSLYITCPTSCSLPVTALLNPVPTCLKTAFRLFTLLARSHRQRLARGDSPFNRLRHRR